MRSYGPAALLLATAACATFSTDGELDPNGTTPPASPSPSGSPPAIPSTGDGHDGPITIATTQTVNVCHRVTGGGGTNVTVDSAAGIDAGRMLVVMQVSDEFAVSGGTSTAVGSAGLWQLTRAQAVFGGSVTVSPALSSSFQTGGTRIVQACTLPEYTTVAIDAGGTLAAPLWDGNAGGVVGFLAQGKVEIKTGGVISANAAGFRGGVRSLGSGLPNVTTLDTSSAQGGGKGESADRRGFLLYGKGNYSNGGGGGNSRRAGGGGGGNGGAGGIGGDQYKPNGSNLATRGLGGIALPYPVSDRIFMGGGGGAGHEDDVAGSAGANGGGVVLLFVAELAGDGTLTANGASAANAGPFLNEAEATGGGGAGGTIAVFGSSGAASFAGTATANGGSGGNIQNDGTNPQDSAGPGAGGGGGRIRLPPNAAAKTADGGLHGNNVNAVAAEDQVWGATDGSVGVIE